MCNNNIRNDLPHLSRFFTVCKLCSSRKKNPYPPHGRSLEIPRGRGVLKVKIVEAKYEAKLEFPGGTRGAKQKTFSGGSIFFGTAHCIICNN